MVAFAPGTLRDGPGGARRDARRGPRRTGCVRVLVCPTVGTTGTGAVDPVREVVDAAREHDVWVHVDAAWAGVAALCPEHRDLLDGVDLVDSFCTDAHKWLLTAFDASLLWVRDGRALPGRAVDHPGVPAQRCHRLRRGRRLPRLAGAAGAPLPRPQAVGGAARRTASRGCAPRSGATSTWPRGSPTRCAPSERFRLPVEPSLALVCLQVVGSDGPRTTTRPVARWPP